VPESRSFAHRRTARRTRRYQKRQQERKHRFQWGWWKQDETAKVTGVYAAARSSSADLTGESSYVPPRRGGSPLLNGPQRPMPHLDPNLPGYKNWDPLKLSENPTMDSSATLSLEWLSYAELLHGRWAMLGAAGCLTPEFLARLDVDIIMKPGLTWFEAGGMKLPYQGSLGAIPFQDLTDVTYWADASTLCFTMFVAMGFAEMRRIQDFKNPGSMGKQYFLGLEAILGGSGDAKYPGGQFFNLFNLGAESQQKMHELKTKEVNNGRLAMVAMLGFGAQAVVTRVGPVENFADVFLNAASTFTYVDTLAQNPVQFEYFGAFTALAVLAFWVWSREQEGAGALRSIDAEDTADVSTAATIPVVVVVDAEDSAAVTMPDGNASLQPAAEERSIPSSTAATKTKDGK